MITELVFMMGEYEAKFPTDRMYGKNHMWASLRGERIVRFGFSSYAVRLLQDVYFLDLTIEPGMSLKPRQEIGSIESKKAESGLYTPVGGMVHSLNEELLEDPTAINLDRYGNGWLFELRAESDGLLSPDAYLEHLEAAWEVTQRTIKGQMNN